MLFEIKVIETIVRESLYTVVADDYDKAIKLAESGETVEEEPEPLREVIDRNIDYNHIRQL